MTEKADIARTDALQFIKQINKGASAIDLSMAIEEAVAAVKDTGLAAEVTYKLKISPFKNNPAGDVTQIWVDDKVILKKPTKQRKGSMFFPTRENTLSRNDPNQMDYLLDQPKPVTQQITTDSGK